MNATQTKLYAVRFTAPNVEGVDRYTWAMGYDPAVFSSREAAEEHREALADELDTFFDDVKPEYYAAETTTDEMWNSEELAQ